MLIEEREVGESEYDLRHDLDIPAFLARILSSRGVKAAVELDLKLRELLPPNGLSGIEKAAKRIVKAICFHERVLVVGDFDADGATATALVVSLLRAMGGQHIDYVVPNRFEFGYGLTSEIVEMALALDPAIIMTVDNGITSHEGVRTANRAGVEVIITDHHLPPEKLPDAYAIVNPNMVGNEFSTTTLAGVGVAYYVMGVVRSHLRELDFFEKNQIDEPNLSNWLDLVALGTIADVVPLDRNNRILVQNGLLRMRAGRVRPGIKALCESADRSLDRLSAADLGYGLGPRLNAAGRLDDISIGIKCLLADELAEARVYAKTLGDLNQTRRQIEQDMSTEALMIMSEVPTDLSGITLYDPNWHQGVIGIVASRMREKYHRPVVVFADSGVGSTKLIKGSGRSVSRVHIRDAFENIATRNPGLIETFGGHAMAAGLTIKRIHLELFSNAFSKEVELQADERDLRGIALSDGELAESELVLESALRIAQFGPWGQGFDEPRFHGTFEVVNQRSVGNGRHLKLVLRVQSHLLDAIAFNQEHIASSKIKVFYRLDINYFGSAPTLQLVIENIETVS